MNSPKKNLLLVTSGFPFGDTERGFISTEFDVLAEKFNVHVIAVGSREELIHPLPENLPVEKYFHRLSSRSLSGVARLIKNALRPITLAEIFRSLCPKNPGLTLRRIKQIIFYAAKADMAAEHMGRIVEDEKTDILYTYWCTEMTLAAAMLKRKHPELVLVTRFHGHDLFTDRKPENYQPFRPFITKQATRLVFACREGERYYVSRWNGADKTRLCYLGCKDAPVLPLTENGELRLVSCSNLIPLKRVDVIIGAVAKLPKELRVRWDHFGDGTERQRLEVLAKEKLRSNVQWHFHGRVPNNTLAARYAQISPRLFITASSTEGGAPVSIQEAFAMGIPAVGTAVGGIPDLIINGKTGYLLEPNATEDELCNAIADFAKLAPEEKNEMSRNARLLWAESFDANKNASLFAQMLAGLKGEKR